MADDDDRQPPQAYDTVAPAGVGAASSNQTSPRAFQALYLTETKAFSTSPWRKWQPMPSIGLWNPSPLAT